MRRLLPAFAVATIALLIVILTMTDAAGGLASYRNRLHGGTAATTAPAAATADPLTVAKSAVFMVLPYTIERRMTGGTGFLIDTEMDGIILVTNRHVCETMDASNTIHLLVQAGTYWVANQIVKSNVTDLCLIRPPRDVAATHAAFRLAAREVADGEHVQVFGHPLLRPLARLEGRWMNISNEPIGLDGVFNPEKRMNMGHLDFMVFPGNSGSPVLNDNGEVVGVVFAMEGGSHDGLTIPLADLKRFIEGRE